MMYMRSTYVPFSEYITARFPDLSLFEGFEISILAILHKSSPFNPSMVLTCWISLSLSMVPISHGCHEEQKNQCGSLNGLALIISFN